MKVEEPPYEDESSRLSPRVLKEFAQLLLQSVTVDSKTEWFKHVGMHGSTTNVLKFGSVFPLWMMSSVGYFMMALKQEGSEIVDFSGANYCAPGFDTIEYKRDKFITCLIEGYFNFYVDEVPLVVSVSVGGSRVYLSIYCNKEDRKVGQDVFDTIKTDINAIPFLKNEKLLLTSYNSIKFLKFPTMTRDSLVLPASIWKSLDRNLFFVAKNKEKIEARGIDWRRGILIWGKPGTGKTLFGRVLCNEIQDMTVMWVTPRCIDDDSDISKIFDMARKLAPTVLFMEDLDFLARSRDEFGPSFILGELLNELDGLSPNDGIFVIGTTNKPGMLDSAIGSRPARFDVRLHFDVPSESDRIKMYKLFLNNMKDINYTNLARATERMSGAHVKETVVRGVIATLHDTDMSLEKAIIEGARELKSEELLSQAPGGLVS